MTDKPDYRQSGLDLRGDEYRVSESVPSDGMGHLYDPQS